MRKYFHDMEGYNGRLDAIQAGILRRKLKHLLSWNEQRQERAQLYNKLLSEVGDSAILPIAPPWAKAMYHLYVIRVKDRDQLIAMLALDNIGTGIHYPIPLHLQTAYGYLAYKEGDFPVSERLAREVVSLPMYPNLAAEQQHRVVEKIREILADRLAGKSDRSVLAAP